MLAKGDHVWIAPFNRGEFAIPIGAKILDIKNNVYYVEDDDGKQFSISGDSHIQLMHPSSVHNVPDMTALGELHECSILRNLFLRYRANQIYTFTGSILIAINPYCSLPIYTDNTMQQYTNKAIGDMPPHLFAIGDNAYRHMLRNSRDQCIIISGESGAGKTESTKLLLQFITTLSGGKPCIGKRILDSNPIMEAFGNAKTVRNDNSSRFGKYVDIHFDCRSGRIVSARIEQYLLEKSRIVRQTAGERNYHAFYCMLAGMPSRDKDRLGLKDAHCYNYLCQDTESSIGSPNDAANFDSIVKTMRYLKFTEDEVKEIWNLLAAILHLGNITFCENLDECSDASKVKDTHRSELRYASSLLGMDHSCLEKAMTTRRLQTAGECVVAQFLPANACAVRDAFVKTIYDNLFRWIVEKINAAIYKPPLVEKPAGIVDRSASEQRGSSISCNSRVITRSNTWPNDPNLHVPSSSSSSSLTAITSTASTAVVNTTQTMLDRNPICSSSAGFGRLSIGVLDIFGFENFVSNSFEQLCINYANENIQQYFVQHIFKLEQEEYLTEGINWTHIKFQDNQYVLDLIAHQPLNILALVDEESRFPRGSDASFLNKLITRHSRTPNFIAPLSSAETRFGIIHFAGPVFYNVEGFLEKNRDTFNHDLLDVINESKNDFLRMLFEKRLHPVENRSRSLTLGMQFKKSLERLMSIINGCHPFFVRCIKPNEFKLPNCFDRDLCVQQLRYAGMMETIQIRSLGYPIRYNFSDFIRRFHMVLQLRGQSAVNRFNQLRHESPHNAVMEICRAAFGPSDLTYAIGSTKVFLRVRHIIIWMQAKIRTKQTRKRYLAQVYFIVKLQSLSRYWLAKQALYLMMHERGIFTSDMAIQSEENTQLVACETELPEDFMLQNSLHVVGKCPLLPNHDINRKFVTASVSENYSSHHLSKPVSIGNSESVKIPKTESYMDLYNFVDTLFENVFSSVGQNRVTDDVVKVNGFSTLNTASTYPIRGEPETVKNSSSLVCDGGEGGENDVESGGNREFKTRSSFHFPFTPSTPPQTSSNTHRPPSTTAAVSVADISELPAASMNGQALWDDCSFIKFAAAYFQTGATPTYSSAQITRPLLKHRNQHDIDLSLKIFAKILTFMKPKRVIHNTEMTATDSITGNDGSASSTVGLHDSNVMCPQVVVANVNGIRRDIPLEQYREADFGHSERSNYTPIVRICHKCKPRLSELHKVRFIVGSGIENPQLRDEIYCQILKQITKNSSVYSRSRGWILLILCAGCFPPSHLDAALKSYLEANASEYATTCLKRLEQINRTGTRTMPPSYMELRAEQERKSLGVNVLCANNTRVRVKVDPTITVEEFSKMAFSAASIRDTFGFEVFISIFDKFEPLMVGPKYLFDNISHYEEYTRLKGLSESDMPWSFSLRKTIFAPWHDVSFDPVATSLICFQVIQQCFKESHESLEEYELAYLLANIYRLITADSDGTKSTKIDLNSWLSQILSEDCDSTFWQKVIGTALQELTERAPEASTTILCENIVTFAKLQWSSVFTIKFDAIYLQSKSRVQQIQLCVDCNKVQLFDAKCNLINSLPYIEIYSVTINTTGQKSAKTLSIQTVWLQEFRFVTDRAENLLDLLNYMLNGLRQRSYHAIAMKSSKNDHRDNSCIYVKAGDYVILRQMGWELDPIIPVIGYPVPSKSAYYQLRKEDESSFSCYGENQRTWETGWIAMSNIYVLPTINPPKPEFVDAFSHFIISNESKEWLNRVGSINSQRSCPPPVAKDFEGSENKSKPTMSDNLLANYSHRPISQTSEVGLACESSVSSMKSACSTEVVVLKHSRLSLRRPFLKELVNADRKIYDAALLSFCLIQTYMGDCDKIPIQLKNMPVIFLTDLLFGSALDCPPLRDEIFIQIMNQLTDNPKRTSENRGMELMWLATGIMVPSEKVSQKLVTFLHRSTHPLATKCYIRLHHTLSRGVRKKPPHALELAAIKQKKHKIAQNVILPNDASIKTALESTTRAVDVIQNVSREMDFTSTDQFALYLETEGELRCIKSDEFIFDALRLKMPEIQLPNSQKRSGVPGSNVNYPATPAPSPLYLKRKLWLNVTPGKYPTEDRLINFPQAVRHFLNGYYKCSLQQALELGTFVFIWHTDDSPGSQTSLEQIIPKNMLPCVTDSQMILKMNSVVSKNRRLSRKEVPVKFLTSLLKIPYFGSSFYHVRDMPSYFKVDNLNSEFLLVVNAITISLVDEGNLVEQWSHSIEDIVECWQEDQMIKYHLRNANSVVKMISTETTAFNACDLINSYIRYHKLQALE
ncbi:hypothetical protein Aperf_G00000029843 [Anoplocephala perfoliata]